MDLLRSCTTNVQILSSDASGRIAYIVFEYRPPEQTTRKGSDQSSRGLEAQLQEQGYITFVEKSRVWSFGREGRAPAFEDIQGWQRIDSGYIDPAALAKISDSTTSDQLDSSTGRLLDALSAHLHRTLNLSLETHALDRFTWLALSRGNRSSVGALSQSAIGSNTPHILIQVRIHNLANGNLACSYKISSTAAEVVARRITPELSRKRLLSRFVVLAPTACFGTCIKLVPATPDYSWIETLWQRFRARFKFVQLFGAEPQEEPWCLVRLTTGTGTLVKATGLTRSKFILWPARLCVLAADTAGTLQRTNAVSSTTWTSPEYQDPFTSAEKWFTATASRKQGLVTVDDADGHIFEADEIDLLEQENEVIASPLHQRSLDPAIVNAIYPTPPDGIMNAHNAPTSSTLNHMEPSGSQDIEMQSPPVAFDDLPSIEVDGQALDEDDGDDGDGSDHGNLFGDMDEDMFEGPDVTDADFNFFDEMNASKRSVSRHLSPRPESADALGTESHVPSVQESLPGLQQEDLPATNELGNALPASADTGKGERTPPASDMMLVDSSSARDRSEEVAISTPPLSPIIVRKRLLDQLDEDDHNETSRDNMNGRSFAPVNFRHFAMATGTKYGHSGKFDTKRDEHEALGPISERSVSLRDYLDAKHAVPRNTSISRPGLMARKPSSTDSDSDSVMSMDSTLATHHEHILAGQSAGRDDHNNSPESELNSTDSSTTLKFDNDFFESAAKAWDRFCRCCDQSGPRDCNIFDAISYLEESSCKGQGSSLLPRTSSPWDLFQVDGAAMTEIAQLVADDHMTSIVATTDDDLVQRNHAQAASYVQGLFSGSISLLSGKEVLTLSELTGLNPTSSSNSSENGKVGPKPLPRRSGTSGGGLPLGQYVMPLYAPFVRLRRVEATWDFMSSAVNFWETLGLEPTHGPKNVMSEIISCGSDDLKSTCRNFVDDMRYMYESTKMGSQTMGAHTHRHFVRPEGGNLIGVILRTMKEACMELINSINERARKGPIMPTVVYLFNPFEDQNMTKFLCASFHCCLQQLDTGSKDIVLQIIPLALISQASCPLIPANDLLMRLCLTIYDKLGPQDVRDPQKSWTAFCAPSITLTNPLSRKINFSLSDSSPPNLLQEAQVLHLAVVVSNDEQWLTCAWTDYSGNHQLSRSFCLVEANRQSIFTAVKEMTRSMMASVTTWRLIVAQAGRSAASDSAAWSDLAAKNISVVVVDIHLSPSVVFYPQHIEALVESSNIAPATPIISQSTLTPVSTPQAANMVSPDPNQPPTPSSMDQSQLQASLEASQDPDAQLVDSRDESYALIIPVGLDRSVNCPKDYLASGMLVKRGDGTLQQELPSLGVDIVEVTPPQTAPGQTSWLAPRSPEYVLREVLAWYRGLGLLAKLRHIRGCEKGEIPWHVGVARAGADALVDFFN